ncbi:MULTISPECIES: IS3 family transposase [Bacillus]|uniref:IS3 family transposase n=1 Tax=Bacillus TaxID=1386 RepID=UPI00146A8653|nr:transposase [Bacillus paranthracis]HDR7790966.1 transposase [Bacillus paranthracis]
MLSEEIQQIFEEHKGRYGSLRITKVLEKKGIKVNRKRVGKLMRQRPRSLVLKYTTNT